MLSFRKSRQANFELLRIFAMVLIVTQHFVGATGLLEQPSGIMLYAARFMYSFTYCCVDIFVLITGFFYRKENSPSGISLAKPAEKGSLLWLKLIFYSWLVFFVAVVCLHQKPSANLIVETAIPFTCKAYWFFSAYILLLFIQPFLDKLINKITTKEHLIAVGLILLFVCLPSTFFPYNWLADTLEGFSIFWFVCLYFIGAYIKRVFDKLNKNKFLDLALYFASGALIFIYFIVSRYLCEKLSISDMSLRIFRYSSIPVLAEAIFIFLFFAKVNIKRARISKLILTCSGTTFSVYLLECCEIKSYWLALFSVENIGSLCEFAIKMLIYIPVTFVSFTIIAFIISLVTDKLFIRISRIIGAYIAKLEKILNLMIFRQ